MIPTLERLEGRSLLAAVPAFSGNVSARLVDGWLVVEGDAAANSLIIRRFGAPYNYQLTARGNIGTTTINGSSAPAGFDGVTRGIRANMRGGDDELIISEVGPAGDGVPGAEDAAYAMRIDMGAGDDELTVERVVLEGRSSFAGGYGNDRIELIDLRTYADLSVVPGAGHDETQVMRADVGGRLTIDDRPGRARVGLEAVNVNGRTTVRTGVLGDSITLRDSAFGQRTRFTTLDGDDHVVVRNTTFATTALIDDGAGEDVMDREVTLAWDFRHGAQGWQAGFAEYSTLTPPGGGSGVEAYRLQSGLSALPAETGWRGRGFLVSGNNLSSNLFMYLSRLVPSAEGLRPGVRYNVSYDLAFASDVHEDSGWAAGSVYLKVGASPRAPRTRSEEGLMVINVDQGIASNGGTEMSVAGDISYGPAGASAAGDGPYQVVRRRHTHPVPIKADGAGRLWLMVGTDSGLPGITTLYYVKVKVRLTPAI